MVRLLFALLLATTMTATTAAYAHDNGDGDGDHDHHHHHHRHHHHDVVLQPDTRIADARLRGALEKFDSSTGLMHFAVVPEAERLQAGNVIVSQPSPGAPYGYLRRITGVGRTRDQVWVTTVPARLNDAIKNAHASVTVILPTDGSHTATLTSGPLVIPTMPATATAPPTSSVPAASAGLGGSYALDLEYHDNSVDLSLHGHETTWVGVNVGVDIDEFCFIDGDPCFSFDTEAADRADTAVTINGQFHGSFSKEFPLASETFDPIVFFIGPVPVVLVPSLDINLNFDGSASGTFSYAAHANAPEYRMSVHWDSGNGFSNGLSSKPAGIDPGDINLVADVDVHARLPAKVQLLLYDAAGVNTVLTADLDAKLHIPHKPRWSVDGRLVGEIGVNASLPIIGDLGSTEATLFDQSFHIAESTNNPPHVSIQTPVNGQQITFSWPDFGLATLSASTNDDEDGSPCCTVDWLLGDGTVLAHGNDVVAQLPGVGHFDITARATDSDGASASSAPVGVDTSIPPAGAGIVLPGAACVAKLYTNLPVRLLGRDGQNLGNHPYTCTWFSDNAADQPQFPPAQELAGSFDLTRGCEVPTFFPTAGTRTITLGVVPDVPGSTASIAQKLLRVVDPPPGPLPLLRETGPAACETVGLDSVTGQVKVDVETRNGGPGTQLSWSWNAGPACGTTPLPVQRQQGGTCVPGFCPQKYLINGPDVAAATPASCPLPLTGTVTVTATDASGASNSTLFYINLFHQIVR